MDTADEVYQDASDLAQDAYDLVPEATEVENLYNQGSEYVGDAASGLASGARQVVQDAENVATKALDTAEGLKNDAINYATDTVNDAVDYATDVAGDALSTAAEATGLADMADSVGLGGNADGLADKASSVASSALNLSESSSGLSGAVNDVISGGGGSDSVLGNAAEDVLGGGSGGSATSSGIGGLAGGVFSGGGSGGGGNGFAETPCDDVYFDKMKSQAWMEAQREVTQNQNIIGKDPSVLQLTCFDQQASDVAKQSPEIFVGSDRWGAVDGINPGSLGTSMQGAIGIPLEAYLNNNFDEEEWYKPEEITHTAESPNCTEMNKLWEDAKCANFADNPEEGFFTLDEFASAPGDKRGSECEKDPRWEENKAALESQAWPLDPVQSYDQFMSSCDTSAKIPTGVEVAHSSSTTYQEKICVAPGCTYNGSVCQ